MIDKNGGAVELSPHGGPGPGLARPWLEGLAAALLIYLLIVLFFRDLVLGGQVFTASGDSITALTFERWGRAMMERGIFPLWNPFTFSGMPSFGSLQFAPGVYPVGWLRPVYELFLLGTSSSSILFHHFLGGVFAYMLLRDLDLDAPLSAFGAVVFFFSPQEIVLGPVAHGGKLFTIAYLPLLLLLTRRILRRPNLLGTALIAVVLALQLLALHMQIAYYGMMMIGLYFLIDSIQNFKTRDTKEHLLRLGALAGAGVLALALASYLLWPVYEYSQFSIRGGSAVGGGVSWQYAVNWSFHPAEALTFIVPSWFGFGGSSYWGHMPFTDHPYYMGLVPLLLAVVAIMLRRREPLVQVLAIVAAFSLLVSFGKWFPILFGIVFKVLPFFGKFRIPAMILVLLLLMVAVLAALGAQGLLRLEGEEREKWAKRLRLAAMVSGVLFLIVLIGKSGLRQAYLPAAVERLAPRAGGNTTVARALAGEAFQLFWVDLVRIAGITGACAFLLHLALKEKVPSWAAVAIVGLLVTVDLWAVNSRLVETVPASEHAREIVSNPHTDFLKAQEGEFRILNLPQGQGLPVPGNYWMSQGIEDVEGYSPAKLRIYEQLRQKQGIGRPNVLAMLNARYVLFQGDLTMEQFEQVFSDGGVHIYEFSGVLGPAWLVGEVTRAEEGNILDAIVQGYDVSERALTAEVIEPVDPGAAEAGGVTLLERDIHRMRYQVDAPGPVLLVMSEVYYPAGWRATVDGEPTPIHRVNHLLRAVRVDPARAGGSSTVELEFAPRSVSGSRTLSLAALLLVVGLAAAGGVQLRRRGDDHSDDGRAGDS